MDLIPPLKFHKELVPIPGPLGVALQGKPLGLACNESLNTNRPGLSDDLACALSPYSK